jgi:hypothetical protein
LTLTKMKMNMKITFFHDQQPYHKSSTLLSLMLVASTARDVGTKKVARL